MLFLGANNRRRMSLRARLGILLLVMILPFIAFSIYQAYRISNEFEIEHKTESLRLAKSVAATVDEYIVATGDALIPIAKHKDVRMQRHEAAKAYLDELVPQYPYYHLIATVDLDGNVQAVSMSDRMAKSEDAKNVRTSVKDTECYRRGVSSSGVSIGEFMHSKLTGMPVVHVTYPIFGPDGKRIGFVAAAFDLTKLQKKIVQQDIPAYTTVSVLDDKLTVIARSKEPEKWVGKNVTELLDLKEMSTKSFGTAEKTSLDGIKKVYGFAHSTKAPWLIRVGVDYAHIQAEVGRAITGQFMVFIPLLLVAVGGWIWMGRDVNSLYSETKRLSLTDPLTGLHNCRKLHSDLERALSSAAQYGRQLSFIMLDIDYFKNYNDCNGHQLGDFALQKAAGLITASVRNVDEVYRYGGEEFCVLLPEADKDDAILVAERIRQQIEAEEFIGEGKQPGKHITASIGVATYPNDAVSKEELIESADMALYKAKENGRNRIVAANGRQSANMGYPSSQCV